MDKNSFLMVGEKTLKLKVDKMCWSPKKDLLCLSSTVGELLLYRLSGLTRVWMLPAPEKGIKINNICWRPDGSVIAVSYNTKEVGIRFIFMEKYQNIWSLSSEKSLLENPVVFMKWTEISENYEKGKKSPILLNLSYKDYICELPKLQTKENNFCVNDENMIGNSRFHILVCVDTEMNTTLFAYGIFPLINIPSNLFQPASRIINVCLNDDFKTLSMILKNKHEVKVILFNTGGLLSDIEICSQAAQRACILMTNIDYLDNVLGGMKEACEVAVQEMETKLTKYLLNKNVNGTIGDEFLDLLLWGKPSDVLEDLLKNNFSEKGLFNLGMLIKSSYISIQQLLLVNFQLACDSIYFHLTDIQGMSNVPKILGGLELFGNSEVEELKNLVGIFMLKSNEMQQVISKSLQSFKAFLSWLYICLSRTKTEEEVEENEDEMTSSDLKNVADFITESFMRDPSRINQDQSRINAKHFNLDKVYQYLQDVELSNPAEQDQKKFQNFVESNSLLSNNSLIIKPDVKSSLKQIFTKVKTKTRDLLNSCHIKLTSQEIIKEENIQNIENNLESCCHWCSTKNDEHSFHTILPTTTSEMVYLRTNPNQQKQCRFYFKLPSAEEKLKIVDVEFYNQNYLSFLLKDEADKCYYLTQVKLKFDEFLTTNECEANNFIHFVEHSRKFESSEGVKVLTQYFDPIKMSTSGDRNVSCLLNNTLSHIKAFEMDQNENMSDDDDVVDNDVSITHCDV